MSRKTVSDLFSSSCPEENASVSIDFLPFSGKITVGGRCSRICAFTFIALAGFALEKHGKPKTKQRNACGMGVVYENTKKQETLGKV